VGTRRSLGIVPATITHLPDEATIFLQQLYFGITQAMQHLGPKRT
jgi:hypothetical protein